MDPCVGTSRVVIVLGPPRSLWPEPLCTLLQTGQVTLQTAATIYEAAGQLAPAAGAPDRAAPLLPILLLDPQVLMQRDLRAAGLILSKLAVTIALLPLDQGASPCAREAAAYGIMSWDQALPALQGVARQAADQTPAALTCPAPLPDNHSALNAAESAGNSVTWDAALRYDEPGMHPLVSEQEIQALLGTGE